MDAINPLLLVLLASLILLVIGLGWALRHARRGPGRRSRARNAAAQAGERRAERLLAAQGYQVIARQPVLSEDLWVDGEPLTFEVRLDLIVERDGERFIAEVKTGELAAHPGYPPTRRQLREYAALLPDHRVLLVCVERGEILEVDFGVWVDADRTDGGAPGRGEGVRGLDGPRLASDGPDP